MFPWSLVANESLNRTNTGTQYATQGQFGAAANEFLNPLPSGARNAISGAIAGNNKDVFIPKEDPREVERLLNLDRINKNIQAGTDAATQTAIAANQQNVAQTQNRLGRAVGGYGGAAVDAFTKALSAGSQGINTAIAQGQERLPYFQGLAQQLGTRISQRALEIDLLNRAQQNAEQAQADKESAINRQGALGTGIATGGFDQAGTMGGQFGAGLLDLFNQASNKNVEKLPTTGITPIANPAANFPAPNF